MNRDPQHEGLDTGPGGEPDEASIENVLGSEPGASPPVDRLARQGAALRAEADDAREIGAHYDTSSSEFDTIMAETNTASQEIELARDLRHLLADSGVVKDPGAVDAVFVNKLGYDICLRPDLVDLGIRVAQHSSKSDGGHIYADDIVSAWEYLEQRNDQEEETKEGAKKLIALGANQDEIVDLLVQNPKTVRIYSRLLEAPILVGYKRHLFDKFTDTKERWSLDPAIAGAMEIIRTYNKRQEAIEAGDPVALQAESDLLASSRLAGAEEVDELREKRHRELHGGDDDRDEPDDSEEDGGSLTPQLV